MSIVLAGRQGVAKFNLPVSGIQEPHGGDHPIVNTARTPLLRVIANRGRDITESLLPSGKAVNGGKAARMLCDHSWAGQGSYSPANTESRVFLSGTAYVTQSAKTPVSTKYHFPFRL